MKRRIARIRPLVPALAAVVASVVVSLVILKPPAQRLLPGAAPVNRGHVGSLVLPAPRAPRPAVHPQPTIAAAPVQAVVFAPQRQALRPPAPAHHTSTGSTRKPKHKPNSKPVAPTPPPTTPLTPPPPPPAPPPPPPASPPPPPPPIAAARKGHGPPAHSNSRLLRVPKPKPEPSHPSPPPGHGKPTPPPPPPPLPTAALAPPAPPAQSAPPVVPPGQGGTPPGQGGTPPGQGGTPPGQGGTPPGHAKH